MPGSFLTKHERQTLDQLPNEISDDDRITYFTLTAQDKIFINKQRRGHNRLGFALQLCILRFLGFNPNNLKEIFLSSLSIITYVAHQLDISPAEISKYGKRDQTRTEHFPRKN